MASAKVVFLVCSMLLLVAVASSAKASECKNNIADLLPCQAAAASATAEPSTDCCTAVEKFKEDPECLCSTIAAAKQAGFTINEANAATIPKRCKLDGYPTTCPKKR